MITIDTVKPIADYENGNCRVRLWPDGTKEIDYEPPAQPEYPVSIDLKITNQCDGGCPWCHECSTPEGQHANVESLVGLISQLPMGTEIAVGGGNPFEHPEIVRILEFFAANDLITNITINAKHLPRHLETIRDFRWRGWLYGMGISVTSGWRQAIDEASDDNTVLHYIAGIDSIDDIEQILYRPRKILVLGYKNYGRGVGFGVPQNLSCWQREAQRLFALPNTTIAFDTLALEQLRIRDYVPQDIWEQSFMGRDGEFTMYVDGVREEFATSSTAKRFPLNGMSIRVAFQKLRDTT